MLLQEKQLSDFSPLYFEFCRFSGGSKLNRSPRCMSPFSLSDGTKIGNNFESCNIVSRFFCFWGKISGLGANCGVPFCSFSGFLCKFAA